MQLNSTECNFLPLEVKWYIFVTHMYVVMHTCTAVRDRERERETEREREREREKETVCGGGGRDVLEVQSIVINRCPVYVNDDVCE